MHPAVRQARPSPQPAPGCLSGPLPRPCPTSAPGRSRLGTASFSPPTSPSPGAQLLLSHPPLLFPPPATVTPSRLATLSNQLRPGSPGPPVLAYLAVTGPAWKSFALGKPIIGGFLPCRKSDHRQGRWGSHHGPVLPGVTKCARLQLALKVLPAGQGKEPQALASFHLPPARPRLLPSRLCGQVHEASTGPGPEVP